MQAIWILICCISLAGCHGDVVVFPPERQRVEYRPDALSSFVYMNQANAEKHFVTGIYELESNTWRWAGRRATLRLHLARTDHLKYVMKFAVPKAVIDRNGPVRLRVLVNDKPWESFLYEKDGIYEVEKPAPVQLLERDADNLVTIEIDKPLPAGRGSRELGFILVHAGFQPAG